MMSEELDGKCIFIACDKGNKKGVGHFVKYIAWLDDDGQVQVHLLDLDASEGTAADCAAAIATSVRKLSLNGRVIKFKGQSTDSGGGGVLDNLARELRLQGLCVEEDQYLVAACAIHCLQLQLSVPSHKLIGDGSLTERNAIQLLNGIHHLQGYFDKKHMVELMHHAQEFADKHCQQDYVPVEGDIGDAIFAKKWNKVRRFRDFQPIGETNWKQ